MQLAWSSFVCIVSKKPLESSVWHWSEYSWVLKLSVLPFRLKKTVDSKLVGVGYLLHLFHSPKAGGGNISECLSCGIPTVYLGCPRPEAWHKGGMSYWVQTRSEEPQHNYKHDIMFHRFIPTRPRSQDMQEDACVEKSLVFWHQVFLRLLLCSSWQLPRWSENCVVALGLVI